MDSECEKTSFTPKKNFYHHIVSTNLYIQSSLRKSDKSNCYITTIRRFCRTNIQSYYSNTIRTGAAEILCKNNDAIYLRVYTIILQSWTWKLWTEQNEYFQLDLAYYKVTSEKVEKMQDYYGFYIV